jgi:hypothetical protein
MASLDQRRVLLEPQGPPVFKDQDTDHRVPLDLRVYQVLQERQEFRGLWEPRARQDSGVELVAQVL